jgi:hypothetical protein
VMPSGVHDGERGGSETGYKKGRYDSIKGFTYKQVEDMMEDDFWNNWILRKSANRKRFRYVIALYVHYEMPEGEWLSAEQIKWDLLEHSQRGSAAMNITPIRIAQLLKQLVAKGKMSSKQGKTNKLYKVIK